jgi:hypothetical protein
MNFLTDSLLVQYDEKLKSILIVHPEKDEFERKLVQIREETYAKMNFQQLAEFLGARLLLLMPTMRAHFEEEIDRMKNKP